MNPDLEARLEKHLGQSGAPDHDLSQLAGVRRLARRRTVRHRIAAGAIGLAALAGIGSLLPATDDSNALITATEPTSAPEPTIAPEPTSAAETNENAAPESEFVDPPVFLSLVSDSGGGFVGVDTFGSDTMQFLRSDDGENWRLDETWALPDGTRFETLSFADGLFIAQLEPEISDPSLRADPLLAVSSDLRSWQYIEVHVERPEPIAGVPEQQVDYRIDSFVRNGDKLAMLVHTEPQFSPASYDLSLSEICGQIDRPAGVTLVLCDGSLRELPPGHASRTDLRAETRAFVSVGGAPATALATEIAPLNIFEHVGSTHAIIADGDDFRVLTPGDDLTDLLPAEVLAGASANLVSTQVGSDSQSLLIARIGDKLVPLHVATSPEGSEVTMGSFPRSALTSPVSETATAHLGYGAAGWVMALVSIEDQFTLIEQNGWNVASGIGGPSAVLRSTTTDEVIAFDVSSNALPPNVHASLFGGMRYLHPETGELLVELTAAEALIPEPWAAIADQFGVGRSLVEDGWVLSGNPVTGPLTLTSPDGDAREFADGFAFDNDDITDGVEADFNNRSFVQGMLYGAGPITFYDDQGTELVTIQSYKIITEFITPVVNEADHFEALVSDPLGMLPFAVVYSANATDWTELAIDDDLAERDVSATAIGDDEILLGLAPRDLLRIPLDE